MVSSATLRIPGISLLVRSRRRSRRFSRVLPPFSPESGSPGTLQSSPATCRHFASERTEPCSYDYFTNGKRGVLGPDLRLDRGKPTFPMVDFGVVCPIREAAEVAIPLLARGMLVRPSGETKSIMGRA